MNMDGRPQSTPSRAPMVLPSVPILWQCGYGETEQNSPTALSFSFTHSPPPFLWQSVSASTLSFCNIQMGWDTKRGVKNTKVYTDADKTRAHIKLLSYNFTYTNQLYVYTESHENFTLSLHSLLNFWHVMHLSEQVWWQSSRIFCLQKKSDKLHPVCNLIRSNLGGSTVALPCSDRWWTQSLR